jgi:uncharacterized protein YjdB
VTDKGGGKFWLTVPKSVNKSESMTLTAKVGNISKTVTVKVYRGKVYSGSSCYDLSTPKINLSQSDCGLTEDDRDFNNKVCCGAECKTCDDNGKSVKMGTIRCLNEGNRSYVQSCQCQGTWSTAQNCASGMKCNSAATACVKPENIEVTQVIMNSANLELAVGQEKDLTVTVEPYNADKTVSWSSNDSKVVTVDNKGKIKAVGVGEAYVSAKSTNGLSSTIKVVVKSDQKSCSEIVPDSDSLCPSDQYCDTSSGDRSKYVCVPDKGFKENCTRAAQCTVDKVHFCVD